MRKPVYRRGSQRTDTPVFCDPEVPLGLCVSYDRIVGCATEANVAHVENIAAHRNESPCHRTRQRLVYQERRHGSARAEALLRCQPRRVAQDGADLVSGEVVLGKDLGFGAAGREEAEHGRGGHTGRTGLPECEGKEFTDHYVDGLCFRATTADQQRRVEAYRRAREHWLDVPRFHHATDFAVSVRLRGPEPTEGSCQECATMEQRVEGLLAAYPIK